MASETVIELRKKSDAAWDNLNRQLDGLESHLHRSDARGEWNARQVMCHLLMEHGWKPVPVLQSFATKDLPVIEITPGQSDVSGWREHMSLGQLKEALDTQRMEVFDYLETLSEADLKRKARIPLFKQFLGTDEVTLATYVDVVYVVHWNDHAGQLAKIRVAAKLPEVPQ